MRGRQSSGWDVLPSNRARKLLARVDAAEYVRSLEEALRERGGDPATLASTADLRLHDLKV